MVLQVQVVANTGVSGTVIDRAAKAQKVTGNRLGCGNVMARRVVAAAYNESRMPYTAAGTDVNAPKLADYLRSPFDLAAFGPRLFLGAALSSREIAQNLQKDVQRAQTMLQGPRPNAEKQEFLAKELEKRLTGYLERGAVIEAELLTAAAAVLPEDVKRQMPPELKDILLRGTVDKRVQPTAPTAQEAATVPIASVTKSQTEAEIEDINKSVTLLRLAITDLKNNKEQAQAGVLKLNVKDARSSLSQRIQQLNSEASGFKGAPIASAVDEAKILIKEADTLNL